MTKKDAKISMEIGVEKSRGYVTADRQKNIEHMIGLIPMDSIFSPIRKGELPPSTTRASDSLSTSTASRSRSRPTVRSRPTMRSPKRANIFTDQLALFIDFSTEEKPVPTAPASEWDVPVETLNLSVRSFKLSQRAGISKVSELLDMTEDEIFKMRNFGKGRSTRSNKYSKKGACRSVKSDDLT